ncbi:MAG TPA: hypothetical protein VGM07_04615 [Stellaceae bacterium]|jgi:hypothetical protein
MAEIEVQRSLLDDVREFIEEKWKHSECELCGADRWMVYPEPNVYAYLLAASDKNVPQAYSHSTVPYVPVSCVNCGNLRLIDARTFEQWRSERGLKARK